MKPRSQATTSVAPHHWTRRGWRFWICSHCYAPKSRHPRPGWVRARPLNDHRYLSPNAPHFNEGW